MSKILQQEIKDLSPEKYYMKHLEIITPFLPVQLTAKEIEVLGWFMSFDETKVLKRFDSQYRKIVKENVKLSNSGLSGHLLNLKNKGAIKEELSGELTIKEVLFPTEGIQMYQFKISIKNG